jgi:hypothetical protein
MKSFSFKSSLVLILQWIGAFVAFIVSMIAAEIISPLPQSIMEQMPEAGFLSGPAAMFFNGAVNATILIWAARRSSHKRFALVAQLFILSFLAQTFQTQIETAYFLPAFPLLRGNFEVYHLIVRGAITSALFVLLVTLLTSGFSRKPREATKFTVHADQAIKTGAWLAALYFVLYVLFGYFVAWQLQELRLFYGGPAELNSFTDQMLSTLMNKPEFPVFQYFRGVLWILPTAALAFPNPLMPPEVSLYHFWEVLLSNGLFGALCAWFVPKLNELRLGTLDEQSISHPEHITRVFENAGLKVDHQVH